MGLKEICVGTSVIHVVLFEEPPLGFQPSSQLNKEEEFKEGCDYQVL